MFTIGVDERLTVLANTFHEVVPPVVRDEWYFVDKALRLKLARAYAARNAGTGRSVSDQVRAVLRDAREAGLWLRDVMLALEAGRRPPCDGGEPVLHQLPRRCQGGRSVGVVTWGLGRDAAAAATCTQL
jgi:hypothetical protein